MPKRVIEFTLSCSAIEFKFLSYSGGWFVLTHPPRKQWFKHKKSLIINNWQWSDNEMKERQDNCTPKQWMNDSLLANAWVSPETVAVIELGAILLQKCVKFVNKSYATCNFQLLNSTECNNQIGSKGKVKLVPYLSKHKVRRWSPWTWQLATQVAYKCH